MQTSKRYFIATALLVFTFGFNSFGQVERTATLICDTNKLINMQPKNAHKVCYFEGQEAGSDPRQYVINGNLGDTIIWKGKPASGSDELNITKIKYEKGTKIFEKDSIEGSKTVRAVAKFRTKDKPDYTYLIYFKVNGRKQYFIDPKVKIN